MRIAAALLPPPPSSPAAPDKRLATCVARCALLGITLQAADDDAGRPLYVANLQALTRQFASLADVEAWLDKVEGRG